MSICCISIFLLWFIANKKNISILLIINDCMTCRRNEFLHTSITRNRPGIEHKHSETAYWMTQRKHHLQDSCHVCYNWLCQVTGVTTINNSIAMETEGKTVLKIQLRIMLDFHLCDKFLKNIYSKKGEDIFGLESRGFYPCLVGSTVLSQNAWDATVEGPFRRFCLLHCSQKSGKISVLVDFLLFAFWSCPGSQSV